MEKKVEYGSTKVDPSRPDSVIILGKRYKIEYTDKPSDVDIYQRESLWGQIDYWTRTIRIYDRECSAEDRWHSIIHEVLHGIISALNLDKIKDDEDSIDILALALVDTLFRNGWLREEITNENEQGVGHAVNMDFLSKADERTHR